MSKSRILVAEDELDRAKKPVLTMLRESSRTNDYWLRSVLSRAQERPEVLDGHVLDRREQLGVADLLADARGVLAHACDVQARDQARHATPA